MNITIMPGAATEDVKKIEEIVKAIDRCMLELDGVITRNIPERLETNWSVAFREEWQRFYKDSVKTVMNGMLLSASNLQKAVDAAIAYSEQ